MDNWYKIPDTFINSPDDVQKAFELKKALEDHLHLKAVPVQAACNPS